jgi:hypothetical protein
MMHDAMMRIIIAADIIYKIRLGRMLEWPPVLCARDYYYCMPGA